jgi:hypothetical protein
VPARAGETAAGVLDRGWRSRFALRRPPRGWRRWSLAFSRLAFSAAATLAAALLLMPFMITALMAS